MPTDVMNTARHQDKAEAKWFSSLVHDWLSRAVVALVLSLLMFVSATGALHDALNWGQQPLDRILLQIIGRAANALFLVLAAVTALTRLRPLRKAAGIEPRISALLGSFLLIGLAVLPRAELPPLILAISSLLVIIGMSASFLVLHWLGKSFSIMAEARRLITHGPYAFVRHPLYICEEIAIIGIFIQVISPVAFILVSAHALIQFRRMINEERVLKATFAEYEHYAAQTPRLIPVKLIQFSSSRRKFAQTVDSRPMLEPVAPQALR